MSLRDYVQAVYLVSTHCIEAALARWHVRARHGQGASPLGGVAGNRFVEGDVA